jgi:hypothetical protein
MINLTPEQRQLLQQGTEPPLLLDPETKREYVLVGVELYQRLKELLGEIDPRDTYPLLHRALSDEGWDDPRMDEYNRYG